MRFLFALAALCALAVPALAEFKCNEVRFYSVFCFGVEMIVESVAIDGGNEAHSNLRFRSFDAIRKALLLFSPSFVFVFFNNAIAYLLDF